MSDSATDPPSRVIANGVPKSGTYFLDSILTARGRWRPANMGIRNDGVGLRNETREWKETIDTIVAIERIAPGHYANAHMGWEQRIEAAIMAMPDLRHVLIYRDPRDTIISMMRWQTYSPKFARNPDNVARQQHLQSAFTSEADRLTYFIEATLDFDFVSYAKWKTSPACHAVQFEELYTEIAGGTFGPAVSGLFEYLAIERADPVLLRDEVLFAGRTSTPNSKKVGIWRDHFEPEHMALIDTPKFREGIQALGYEL